jgi:hypothetical protein
MAYGRGRGWGMGVGMGYPDYDAPDVTLQEELGSLKKQMEAITKKLEEMKKSKN